MPRVASDTMLSSMKGNDNENFQRRRKRAAKLTKFFGTDYRSLFGEVLESIENGVRDDQKRGSLSAEEVQVRLSFFILALDG